MKTINHEAGPIGGTRSSAVPIAVLLTLGCWAQASDQIRTDAPRRPAVAAEDRAATTTTTQPDRLCAGDRPNVLLIITDQQSGACMSCRQRWGYYRMIEKVDGEIDKVLKALRRAGEESRTLVIFTSDHGDCTGAHRFNQKTVFYDESVRVPLIVSWKGKTVAGTSDNLVNTGIDVLPTMLDCAGIEKPEKLPGRSLLPLALGRPVGPWRDYVVSQNHMAQAGEIDGFTPTMEGRMVRTDRYKYCVYSRGMRRESLVDMVGDPGETTDLAGDPKYREVLLEHRQILDRFGRKHDDPLVADLLADDVKPNPFAPAASKKAGDK